jgi:hypothetical protein
MDGMIQAVPDRIGLTAEGDGRGNPVADLNDIRHGRPVSAAGFHPDQNQTGFHQ